MTCMFDQSMEFFFELETFTFHIQQDLPKPSGNHVSTVALQAQTEPVPKGPRNGKFWFLQEAEAPEPAGHPVHSFVLRRNVPFHSVPNAMVWRGGRSLPTHEQSITSLGTPLGHRHVEQQYRTFSAHGCSSPPPSSFHPPVLGGKFRLQTRRSCVEMLPSSPRHIKPATHLVECNTEPALRPLGQLGNSLSRTREKHPAVAGEISL